MLENAKSPVSIYIVLGCVCVCPSSFKHLSFSNRWTYGPDFRVPKMARTLCQVNLKWPTRFAVTVCLLSHGSNRIIGNIYGILNHSLDLTYTQCDIFWSNKWLENTLFMRYAHYTQSLHTFSTLRKYNNYMDSYWQLASLCILLDTDSWTVSSSASISEMRV